MKLLIACLLLTITFAFSSCHRGPVCPAYNGLTHNNQFNPNVENKEYKSNKEKVEAKKKAELSRKKVKRGKSSLFPKGVKIRR